jgi:hypothetical protein
VLEKFCTRNINPYLFLNTKPQLLWCSDAYHLLKLNRYKIVGNILSISFNIDKKLIKIKELKKLFPNTNPDCFKPEKMYKMRDYLAL